MDAIFVTNEQPKKLTEGALMRILVDLKTRSCVWATFIGFHCEKYLMNKQCMWDMEQQLLCEEIC